MANKIDLYNVNVMGTPTDPVRSICVGNLIVLGEISYGGPTLAGDPPVETKYGIGFNSVTGKIEYNSAVSTAVTFDSTIGVTGTATMAAITASGVITANGGLTLGANMTTGSNWIRGSGANVGMKFTGANVEFSGTLSTGGTATLASLAVTGESTFSDKLRVNGNIDLASNFINDTGNNNEGLSFASGGAIFKQGITGYEGISAETYLVCKTYCQAQYYIGADGMSAPSATAGKFKIYVDGADGDLKVIFGDGTIKTLATDT